MALTFKKESLEKDGQWLSSSIRLDQIDVLRGLAAMMVVLHHCWVHAGAYRCLGYEWFGHRAYLTNIYSYGYIGVDLFLVLSGFCLSWPFLNNPTRSFSWLTYAKKRLLRIWPTYLLTVSLLLVAGFLWRWFHFPITSQTPQTSPGFAELLGVRQVAAALTLQKTFLNSSFWSLCLEMRWYFVFPFVLLFARRCSAWLLLPVALVLCALCPIPSNGPLKLLIYLPDFVAGVLVAEVHARAKFPLHQALKQYSLLGFSGFAVLCFFWLPGAFTPGRGGIPEAALTTGLFFFLLLFALNSRERLSWPLRGLKSVGIFSYSLYLIHQPIIEASFALLHTQTWAPLMQWMFWQTFFVLFLLGMGFLFYLAAEKPFLDAKLLLNVKAKMNPRN